MVPGQRSSWRPEDGAAAVRGDAVASAFMGIDDDEVERLLAVRFVSLFHERSESLLRLREHALNERLLIAEMEKMVEELDGSPTQTQELDRRIEELKKRVGRCMDFQPMLSKDTSVVSRSDINLHLKSSPAADARDM
ncbi:hypothetical protein ZWY2020_038215 [Hordeum vulgare]|nr:hypothetical protein ZWY2020_038215 [Hordeum vulgare]